MTNNDHPIPAEKLRLAREWAEPIDPRMVTEGIAAAAEVILSLPDELVDGAKVRELIDAYKLARDGNAKGTEGWMINRLMVNNLEALLPEPARPTLADLTEEEREACVMTKCDLVDCHDDEGEHMIVGTKEDIAAVLTRGESWPVYMNASDVIPTELDTPESATESADADGCQIEGAANPSYDTARLWRDKDGDVWEHIDGLWVCGESHEERVRESRSGLGWRELPASITPYTLVEDEQAPRTGENSPAETPETGRSDTARTPRPEDVPEGELWLVRYQSKVTAGHRPAPHSTFPWTLLVGTSHNAATDSEVTLIRRVEVDQ